MEAAVDFMTHFFGNVVEGLGLLPFEARGDFMLSIDFDAVIE